MCGRVGGRRGEEGGGGGRREEGEGGGRRSREEEGEEKEEGEGRREKVVHTHDGIRLFAHIELCEAKRLKGNLTV